MTHAIRQKEVYYDNQERGKPPPQTPLHDLGTCESAVCIRIESRIESAVGPWHGTARRMTAVGQYRGAPLTRDLVSALVSGGVVEAANDVLLVDGATENAGPKNAGLNIFYFCR